MTQQEYAEILFNDCGFSPSQRRDFLGLRYRDRRYLDMLTVAELSVLIADLKARKVQPGRLEDDEDPLSELTAKQRAKHPRGGAQ